MESARPLFTEMGYEVWETPDEVLFCDRRISMLWFWRMFLGGWTLALVVIAPLIGVTVAMQGHSEGYTALAIGTLVGSALGLATLAIHRAFVRRRAASLADIPKLATIDRSAKTFRMPDGAILPCTEARVTIERAVGDSSRGIMRWVVVWARG